MMPWPSDSAMWNPHTLNRPARQRCQRLCQVVWGSFMLISYLRQSFGAGGMLLPILTHSASQAAISSGTG